MLSQTMHILGQRYLVLCIILPGSLVCWLGMAALLFRAFDTAVVNTLDDVMRVLSLNSAPDTLEGGEKVMSE